MNKYIIIFIFIVTSTGCSGIFNSEKDLDENYGEPAFSENPFYNYRKLLDEGWELIFKDDTVIFVRTIDGKLEIYIPTYK